METTNNTKKKNKKIIGISVAIVVFWISYYISQQIFSQEMSFDKNMVEVANEINKNCPIMVDQYTQLDNAMTLPGNIFQYNYTLITITKDEVDLDTVKRYIEPGIINNVKTNPDLKLYRDHETTLNYYYKDRNGEFVHKISVTPDMYKSK